MFATCDSAAAHNTSCGVEPIKSAPDQNRLPPSFKVLCWLTPVLQFPIRVRKRFLGCEGTPSLFFPSIVHRLEA